MNAFEHVRVRVRIRRGHGYVVKPEAEPLDGREFSMHAAWRIGADESLLYAGEWALCPDDPEDFIRLGRVPMWIASGDVEILHEDAHI